MISRLFINRPIVAMVIAIVTVIGGLVAMAGLPVAQFPEIVPPQIIVNTTYTGADAVTSEQSVATPLEQQMSGVDNMLYMQSTNANDGTMTLTVTFDIDTNPNIDQVNVQNRVAQAQPNLPADVNQFGLNMRKSTGIPTLAIAIYSPQQTHDSLFLANYANININDALYRVPGVGEVRLFGASDYAMRIWVKPDLLAKLGLTVPDLVRAVQQQSTVNPAGQVGAEPAPKGKENTYTLRAQGRLQTPEEFEQIVVRINPDGSVVRLKDVARIELGAQNYQQVARFGGQPAGIIAVFQAPGSNALAVTDGVKKTMADLKKRFPADFDYAIGLDTTRSVTEGISEIVQTLLIAIVLVLLVVFIFLQNWRATLIPMIAVPVSLIGTFAVFPLLGFSINTLSLFALVLAIGLVVDDAIVVVEAVEHHIEEGMSPREATLKAMEEVSGPVISIALILGVRLYPGGFGQRNSRAPEQTVRRHHRGVGCDLSLQRLDVVAGPGGTDAASTQGSAWSAGSSFCCFQSLVCESNTWLCQLEPWTNTQGSYCGVYSGGICGGGWFLWEPVADQLSSRRGLRFSFPQHSTSTGSFA
jgi:HAE1 family hydrophobic/amphiphilic exporter-1